MSQKSIGIIMNGATGRMGYRQHLVRSILAIREQGGVLLSNGERVQVEPLLVGRSEAKLAELAQRHGITDYTTDLDAALADPRWEIYADFLVTKARAAAIRKAIAAGKAIYTEKPTAESVEEALELAALARAAGIKNGVVHDNGNGIRFGTNFSPVLDGVTYQGLLNLGTSQYLTLNGSGSELWRLLAKGATEAGLVSHLVTTYELSADVAASDVAVFLEECRQHEVIEVVA